jgi:hypothetical protein
VKVRRLVSATTSGLGGGGAGGGVAAVLTATALRSVGLGSVSLGAAQRFGSVPTITICFDGPRENRLNREAQVYNSHVSEAKMEILVQA